MPTEPVSVNGDTADPPSEKKKEAFFGRKFSIFMMGLIVYGIIVCFKSDIEGKDAIDNLIWLVLIGTGSIAIEDGIGKITKTPKR